MDILKTDVKNLGEIFKQPVWRKGADFFRRRGRKIIIFAFSAATLFYCLQIWYSYIYAPQWSDVRREEYIRKKDQGTAFNVKDFEKTVGEAVLRKSAAQETLENVPDIFRVRK